MASLCNQEPVRGDLFPRPAKRQRTDSRVPPGWLDCPNFGKKISSIIPSKVPLDETFNREIPIDKRYSVEQLKHLVSRNLGLVIDLTNTNRYYSDRELKNAFEGRVDYVNIPCRGHGSVPDNDSVNKFVYEVSQFQKNSREGQCILVHCTHGFNRTGYMIVHYLMRTLEESVSVTRAIKIFADARPPGIYKPEYIDALYTFYHEKKPESIVYPLLPKWKDGVYPVNVSDGELVKSDGDAVPWKQQEDLRRLCYELLGLGLETRCSRFPGSHPVSLDLKNLKLLRRESYSATWKADGTRYMMLITRDGCYLIDRKFNFRRVQMRFPRIGSGDGFHHKTLLDGEMVIDTVPQTGFQERRFLVYDMMACNGVSVVKEPFKKRWRMAETEVIGPRNCERKSIIDYNGACEKKNIDQIRKPAYHYYRYEKEPFRVRRKEFWELPVVPNILDKFIPTLTHKSDGLIFQAWGDPYKPHAHSELLKWKYPEMNSVDFLFQVDRDRHQLYLFDRGQKKLLLERVNAVVFEDGTDPRSYSGKIIECSWIKEENVWAFMRVRDDKDGPNAFGTYKSVEKSIEDNITEEMLKGEIRDIIRLPIYADRMQQQPNAVRAVRRK